MKILMMIIALIFSLLFGVKGDYETKLPSVDVPSQSESSDTSSVELPSVDVPSNTTTEAWPGATYDISSTETVACSEFMEIYEEASEIVSWFEFGNFPYDYDNMVTLEDGMVYVEIEGFSSIQQLRDYMSDYFSMQYINNNLLSSGILKEYDGKLYGIPVGRGSDITKGEATYTMFSLGEQEYVLRAKVEILSDYDLMTVVDYEYHDFMYVYMDGKWVFYSFPVIW